VDRFNLGSHTRAITTSSIEAQRYFNIGLNWCYGFNQEEGLACFQEALKHDPHCVMAHWGIAYAAGPFYNNLWRQHSEAEADTTTRLCHQHIQLARSSFSKSIQSEITLVEALAHRFQKPHVVTAMEFDRWDDDYANAMRRVYYQYPDDHDIAALCAEALMTRTAWKLWDVKTGIPTEGADTLEALTIIEKSIAAKEATGALQHPAILHLHIHVTEMSNTPERALRSADILGELCPDAGHLNHMPGHIYMLCGEYEKARLASEKAIQADELYVDYAGAFNFYTTARAHDLHLMMFTCMFMGKFQEAINAATAICDTISYDVLSVKGRPQMITTLEGYYSMKMHVLVRFGRWHDIINEPIPSNKVIYPVTVAMHHYAKCIAHAFLNNIDDAQLQRSLYYDAISSISEERMFFNNPALSILAVGTEMMEGELAYHMGLYEKAFGHLRQSVRQYDELHYSEPWPWMHPPRHALAALLAEQGQYEEAERVYRADLGLNDDVSRCAQHPDNIWALHGLTECLVARGEKTESIGLRSKLSNAQKLADTQITSSCLCRQNTIAAL